MTELLSLSEGETVAIVGCGGKTALLFRLAEQWRHGRVLVATTTKIMRPQEQQYDFSYDNPQAWRHPVPQPGIHVAGCNLGPKLGNLPAADLKMLRSTFDLTLLECDGSRGLPLKGWREDEPAVPDFADVTVGVAVVWPIDLPVTGERVFQPQLFCAISGAALGQPLTLEHLAAAVRHPKGLFHRAKGRKILLINQVEDDEALCRAKRLAALLPVDLPVIAGSLRDRQYTVLGSAQTRKPFKKGLIQN